MTERMTTWRDGEETILDSDIWRVAKNLTPMSAEDELEAWRRTVKVLEHLSAVADTLLIDPLILALADAKSRAEEELERARERTMRPAGEVTEYEDETLQAMLRHADGLGTTIWVVEEADVENTHDKANALSVLEEMRKDVGEQLLRYKQECGLPHPF